MRKTVVFLFIMLSYSVYSQVSIAKITRGETELLTIPRLTVDIGIPINIVGPYAILKDEATYLETGLFVTNNGFIFEENDLRNVHRTVGISVPIRVGKIVKQKYYLGTGHNFNFPIHYKLKTFDAGTRDNKQIAIAEYFSDRVSFIYPSLEFSAGVSLHGIGRFSLRLQMFYLGFFNPAFSETINGAEIKPYEDLLIENQMKIIFSYNPGL